jgi:hypothetical protein
MLANFIHTEWVVLVFILLHISLVFSAVKIARYLSRLVRSLEIFQAEHHLMMEHVANSEDTTVQEIRLRAIAYAESHKGAVR